MTENTVVTAMVLATSVAACVLDVRTRRIPNVLTFGSALAGVAFHTLSSGGGGALTSAGGWLTGTLLFLPFFALRGMGGGDVKLLAALGAWLGPQETLWLAAYSALAGGVIGAGVALARGYLGTALRNVLAMITYWMYVGFRPVEGLTLDAATPRLAYAIPILAGTMVTLWR